MFAEVHRAVTALAELLGLINVVVVRTLLPFEMLVHKVLQ